MRDATNTLAGRVKSMRIRLAKKHTQVSITQLRDRKQVVSHPGHKSDIIHGEAVIYLDDTGPKRLILLVILKSHILLVWQVSEAGEPFLISGHVSRATGIHEPHVLQASIYHLHRTRKGRWLSAGVSEINLRNSALNHATRRGFHNPLHVTTWLWGPNQETVAVILRPKSPNQLPVLRPKQGNPPPPWFWGSTKKPTTGFEAKPGKTIATSFEAKLEKTVTTGFEAKPAKTVWVVLRPNHSQTVDLGFKAQPRNLRS
jgi:hypothetical protein